MLPPQKPQPSRLAVLSALNSFIESPSLALLKKKQNLLLTVTAIEILTERIKRIEASGGQQDTFTFKFYRWFFQRASRQEIEVACEDLRILTDSRRKQTFITLCEFMDQRARRGIRRMLEHNLDLLNPESIRALELFVALIQQNPELISTMQSTASSTDLQERRHAGDGLRLFLEVFYEARRRGGTAANVREAYVNFWGGRTLDVPAWFEEEEEKLFQLGDQEQTEQTMKRRAEILRNLIQRYQEDVQIVPETLAELHLQLAEAISHVNLYAGGQELYDEIILLHNQVLHVYTSERYPYRFAITQKHLGDAYLRIVKGSHRQNLEQAICCYENTLTFLSQEVASRLWAETQVDLSHAYLERLAGSKPENIEKAIVAGEAALEVFTRKDFPEPWASTQHALANAYFFRSAGSKADNLERAIEHYYAALQEVTEEKNQHSWGMAHYSLGNSYNVRIEGSRGENLEQAIAHFHAALRVFTRENFSLDWAMIHSGLGKAYLNYRDVNNEADVAQAIIHFTTALEVFTPTTFPTGWAATQLDLGIAHFRRIGGNRQEHLEVACTHYKAALQVYEDNGDLNGERTAFLNLGKVEVERRNWEAAYVHFAGAYEVENQLAQLGAGVMDHDLILGGSEDAATRASYALVRMGKYAEAAVALEKGRARTLAEGLRLNSANPQEITNEERRKRFEEARDRLNFALRDLNTPFLSSALSFSKQKSPDEEERRIHNLQAAEAYRRALEQFNAVIDEIQAANDPPHFLKGIGAVVDGSQAASDPTNFPRDIVEASTILATVARISSRHALVYLVVSPWGGFALVASNTEQGTDQNACFFVVELPHLTEYLIADLLITRLRHGANELVGGYNYAQQRQALGLLSRWSREGRTFREAATALHELCTAFKYESMLDKAAQKVLVSSEVAPLVDMPLNVAGDKQKMEQIGDLAAELEDAFLHYELERSFKLLGPLVLSPLMTALQQRDIASLTLIPCGLLAAFPLAAVPLGDERPVGEIMPTSIMPGARSLPQEVQGKRERKGVYALGNPQMNLKWGEAEAQTLFKMALLLQLGGGLYVQTRATREKLIKALEEGLVIDISCHGLFDSADFRNSSLLLAQGERLYLGTLLSHEVDLRGIRLLILSACQTSVLDIYGAVNEVRSLASGVLQSGAQAVLASLWPVDDYATYLLMVQFAQLWLPDMKHISPADALAQAQQWLRTVTWGALQSWDMLMPVVHSNRLDYIEARDEMRRRARWRDPALRPFESPIYWAGFQVVGW